MIATIFGVDHECQRNDRTGEFQTFLRGQLDKSPVGLLAEEAVEGNVTAGRRIASELSIRWLGMDATQDERIRLRI